MSSNSLNSTSSKVNCTSSVPNSVKKSARKPLVVRETLASKLRAQHGNKLTYYKNKLQELRGEYLNTTITDSSISKENTKSVDTFKKPLSTSAHNQQLKTPIYKRDIRQPSSTTKSSTKTTLSSSFRALAKNGELHIPLASTSTDKKTVLNANTVGTNMTIQKENKNPTTIIKTIQNKPWNNKQTPIASKYSKNTNLMPKLNENKPHTSSNKTMYNNTKPSGSKQTPEASKFMSNTNLKLKINDNTSHNGGNNIIYNNTKPLTSKQTPVASRYLNNKISITKNIQSTKKSVPNHTDPIRKPVQISSRPKENNKSKSILKPLIEKKSVILPADKKKVTMQSPIRKSLSAMHFKRVTNRNRNSIIQRARSLANFTANNISPIIEESFVNDSDIVKTPFNAKRRSIAHHTPMTIKKRYCSPFLHDSTTTSANLQERLALWLEKTGKPFGSFHHLRCFGINSLPQPIGEENKENLETHIQDTSSSYNDLRIHGEATEEGQDTVVVANDALFDLHKLIREGYPRDQCEEWLNLIKGKYAAVENKSQYWECRAALEEARGDITTAVDCYKIAIIKGAQVSEVDVSLDNLLQKFSVLNITPTKATTNDTEHKTKNVLEARNIFKSSIINFAIQERSIKTEQNDQTEEFQFVATPVRRSTRASRSHYVSTPGVTVCPTLNDLESPIRNSLHFTTNKALH